jgi:hypothetical protein
MMVRAGAVTLNSTATVSACMSQALSTCAQFAIVAENASTALLTAVSGAGQELAASGTPAPLVVKVTDLFGRPLAGATVGFYQTLSAWQPACASEGFCPPAQTLQQQAVTEISDANGLVTVTPLTLAGQATNLLVNATTGAQTSVVFSVTQHP